MTSLWVKKGKNIQKLKSPKLLSVGGKALFLLLASIIKDMYFFWHMLCTWMCLKQSLYRKNPAALAVLSITLKIKVHFASLQTNRNWGEKKKKQLEKEKWANQHYSIYFKLPALQDKKQPRHIDSEKSDTNKIINKFGLPPVETTANDTKSKESEPAHWSIQAAKVTPWSLHFNEDTQQLTRPVELLKSMWLPLL